MRRAMSFSLRKALAARDRLQEQLATLDVPEGILEQVINHFALVRSLRLLGVSGAWSARKMEGY